jgi:hypothetical protein
LFLAQKDVTKTIRETLYGGGWSTVEKELQAIADGSATSDEETILFSLERLRAANWKNIPFVGMKKKKKKKE